MLKDLAQKKELKQYVETHKEEIKERKKKYHQENKDKEAQENKQYRKKNPDKVKKWQKQYREKNKEKRKEKTTCSCGSIFIRPNKSQHIKSIKHQKWLETQT